MYDGIRAGTLATAVTQKDINMQTIPVWQPAKSFSRAQRDRENDKQLTDRKHFDPQLGLDEKWNGRILTGLFSLPEPAKVTVVN